MVLFAVDQAAAESKGALRGELNLLPRTAHRSSKPKARPGIGPGYLIIDALDAARE